MLIGPRFRRKRRTLLLVLLEELLDYSEKIKLTGLRAGELLLTQTQLVWLSMTEETSQFQQKIF